VVLAERDGVSAELVGERGLGDDLPDRLGVGHEGAGVVRRHVAEGVESEHEIAHRLLLDVAGRPSTG
jgi:hypothetical protein